MPYKPPQRERPSIDPLVVKDALKLMPASSRRLFLRQTLTIGGSPGNERPKAGGVLASLYPSCVNQTTKKTV